MSKRLITVLAAVAVAAGIAAALAIASGDTGAGSQTATQTAVGTSVPEPQGQPTPRADAALTDHFALLRQRPESVGKGFALAKPGMEADGVNTSLGHVVPEQSGAIAVAPAVGGLCVSSVSVVGCPDTAAAVAGKAYVIEACSPNLPAGTSRLFGVLPDGASNVSVTLNDGSSRSVALNDNTYLVESQVLPDTLRWTQDGTTHEEPLPTAGQPNCG